MAVMIFRPIDQPTDANVHEFGLEVGGVRIDTTPEAIDVDFARAAIMVIDMQNAFVREGGYFDTIGVDIEKIGSIVVPCRKIINAARTLGIKVVYMQMTEYSQSLLDVDEKSPHLKKRAARLSFPPQQVRESYYYSGTWGHQIIDELRPLPQDIVIEKHRHDGFIDTELHRTLTVHNVNTLFFTGIATNICVESTLRHAFFLDYYAIIVSDAVSPMGPDMLQAATLTNVQSTFGWIASSNDLKESFRREANNQGFPPSV